MRLWNLRSHTSTKIIAGGTALRSLALTEDGSRIAGGDDDGVIRVWRRDGTQLGRADDHGGAVTSLAFGPGDDWLVSGSSDGTVRFRTATGVPDGDPLGPHRGGVTRVAVSPDGSTVAAAGVDGRVRIWEVASRRLRRAIPADDNTIWGVAFNPDGSRLATASDDTAVGIWDVRSGRKLGELTGHSGGASDVRFSPDGRTVLTASRSGELRLWDTDTLADLGPPLPGHDAAVWNVAWLPDGGAVPERGIGRHRPPVGRAQRRSRLRARPAGIRRGGEAPLPRRRRGSEGLRSVEEPVRARRAYARRVAPVVIEVRQPGTSSLWLVFRERLVMGRDCDGLLLRDPQVSRAHLALDVDDHGVTVTDLGSTNGTLLNGVPLTGTGRAAAGDTIAAGGTTVRVTLWSVDQVGESDVTGMTPVTVLADEVARATLDTGPLVSSEGTVTIMFSDIESSTEMTARLGDQRWMALLREHDKVVRAAVLQHGGRVVKSQGDGFMASFKSARAAVLAAIAIERETMAVSLDDPHESVRVRLGVHTGEAISARDGDLFGRHVVLAARIADAARGGEILVSSLVREISLGSDLSFGAARSVHLKGLGEHVVHEVLWSQHPSDVASDA